MIEVEVTCNKGVRQVLKIRKSRALEWEFTIFKWIGMELTNWK